jgi:hypothetical protein
MSPASRFGVMTDATSVAMRAMVGDLDPLDVDHLVTRATQLLETDDPVFRAVTGFATQHELYRRQPDQLRELGTALRDQMLRLMQPDPPDLHRSDIHG